MPEKAVLAPPGGHLAEIRCLSFSPDGHHLVSGGETLLIWDVDTGEIAMRLRGHEGLVFGCEFLPDGRRVVSGGATGEVLLWDTTRGEIVERLQGLPPGHSVKSLRVRTDGGQVMVGTDYGQVMAWSLDTYSVTWFNEDLEKLSGAEVWTVGFLPGSGWFAGSQKGVLVVRGDNQPAERLNFEVTSGVALPGARFILGGSNVCAARGFRRFCSTCGGSRQTLRLGTRHQSARTSPSVRRL